MKTFTLKSTSQMTAPLIGTPVLPSFDPSLMASYDRSSAVTSDGTTMTKWKNKQGILGTEADLIVSKPTFPTILRTTGIFFPGGGSESYMDSAVFTNGFPIGKATFLARMRFTNTADELNCTIFSSLDSVKYAFLRRKANATLTGGVATPEIFTTTQTLAINTWADVAFVIDGANSKVYINDSATTVNPFNNGMETVMPSLRLGANFAGVNRLVGEISNFNMYSRALSLAELQEVRAAFT